MHKISPKEKFNNLITDLVGLYGDGVVVNRQQITNLINKCPKKYTCEVSITKNPKYIVCRNQFYITSAEDGIGNINRDNLKLPPSKSIMKSIDRVHSNRPVGRPAKVYQYQLPSEVKNSPLKLYDMLYQNYDELMELQATKYSEYDTESDDIGELIRIIK